MSSRLTVRKSRPTTGKRNKPSGNSTIRKNPDSVFAAQNMGSPPTKRAKILKPIINNQTYDPKELEQENMGERYV